MAVLKKEISSYFKSPLAYVFLGVFYLFSGIFFYTALYNGIADIDYIFAQMFIFILILIPLLTMKMLSEEKRSKTDQALLCAPVSLKSIILAKFLAAYFVYFIGTLINIIFGIILNIYTKINWTSILANYLGMLLLGGAIIAIGLFVSALTESQAISAVCTYGAVIFLILLDSLVANITLIPLKQVVSWISLNARYNPFTSGIVDYSNILYFLSLMAIFIFLSIKAWDKRRWN